MIVKPLLSVVTMLLEIFDLYGDGQIRPDRG
jgi:hypothetical protein